MPLSAGPIDSEGFDDPAMTARYRALIEDLRCLVCQNQNIAGSNADLAKDLRRQVRELMTAGKTDTEISQYMVDRYGDFVLYKPPVRATTMMLWTGPFVLLAVGLFFLVMLLRGRSKKPDTHLTEEQRQSAREILNESGGDK